MGKKYDVYGFTGGYGQSFSLDEAKEIAREESTKYVLRIVAEAEHPYRPIFIYYDGVEYAPTEPRHAADNGGD